jgi:hypothetical protein
MRYRRTSCGSVFLPGLGVNMSLFDRDRVDLLKQDGTKFERITATVGSSELIVIKGSKQVIEIGDLLIRKLSNGGEETYKVLDPQYHERTPGGFGPHYQLKVKKLGVPEAQVAVQHIVYNISGNNARVNVGSVDNSTNISGTSDLNEQLEIIRSELLKLSLPEAERADALDAVDAVEAELAKERPKRGVIFALLNSLPKVAAIADAGAKLGELVAASVQSL